MHFARIRWSPRLLAEAGTEAEPCTGDARSTAAASTAAASIAAASTVGLESDMQPRRDIMALCAGTPPIRRAQLVTMAAPTVAGSIMAGSIVAVCTGAVGCTAVVSIAAVDVEWLTIVEAVGDRPTVNLPLPGREHGLGLDKGTDRVASGDFSHHPF